MRFYAGSSLYGVFIGPSVIAGWYSVNYYGSALALPDVGYAVDFGGKARLGDRGFLTFGFGAQNLITRPYPSDIAGIVSFVIGSGWAPRLLMTIGSTF